MDKLLSFIVPVYNVEGYLEECINSVVTQSDDSCEVILVDDGSTDSSGSICDRYQSKYNIIKVIHKENGGLASARNVGLDYANGKYVCFLDSDDRIAGESISNIIKWAKKNSADMCFMQAVKFFPDETMEDLGDNIKSTDLMNKDKCEIIKMLTKKTKFPGSSCTKLFLLSFLKDNSLCFPRQRILSEDLGFVLSAIHLARTYACLDFRYYEYRQNRKGSITNEVSEKTLDGLIKFIDDAILKLTDKKKPLNEIAKYLMGYVAYEYSVLLLHYAKYCGENEEYKLYLKRNRWILNYSRTRNISVINYLTKILGIDTTAKIIKIAKQITR